MRIFVTGATGFVGEAVVRELLAAGHSVLGLARSDAGADTLTRLGAAVHRGDLLDTAGLAEGAKACDGVIHLAFIHDFSRFKENCEIDRGVIAALGGALAGSDRPLVVTSGTGLLSSTRIVTEEDMPQSGPNAVPRIASEEAAAALVARGVNASIMRLPPTVHGDGDHGFVPMLIALAREKGVSAYVGEGLNRWPAVHRFDAAQAFRLALEKGVAGARYHAVAEEGVAFRDIASVIGQRLNVPVVSKNGADVAGHFGWFAHFAGMDNLASSQRTRELLGWEPKQIGLIADLDRPPYFEG
ncbi:SDR family oxidoreductase [Paraburkholderia sp. BCC1885]|uniref:SDR family oxidoreductase n=1 Tax=Paraburkholderia sp. BCC1885 TaxID=2562669 RepID=UPI0011844B53|nr:SDR family oxidoreductase [Paraburkholderia sp. BCC1885]